LGLLNIAFTQPQCYLRCCNRCTNSTRDLVDSRVGRGENAGRGFPRYPLFAGPLGTTKRAVASLLRAAESSAQSYLLLSKQLESAQEIERESDKATTYGDNGE